MLYNIKFPQLTIQTMPKIQQKNRQYKMQANCCVFPAPKQFQFTSIIQKKIVLIPKNNPNALPQYYLNKHILKINQQPYNNQFVKHIKSRMEKSSQNLSTINSTVELNMQEVQNKKFQVYSIMQNKAEKNMNMHIRSAQMLLEQKYNQTNIPKVKDEIPCLFLPSNNSARKDKIMVFFHGNGQDLASSYEFGYYINHELQIAVLIIQYQGYSIYEGKPTPLHIVSDSKTVIEYLINTCGYTASDILLFGRSIGGAIAFEAASHYESSCLILLSPFLSLKKVAQDLYGKCASTLLKDTLDNATIAQTVKCPILIIHGLKDNLVPYHHSISILKQCKGYSRLKLVENMTHIKFNFKFDFIMPVKKFLDDLQILKKETIDNRYSII